MKELLAEILTELREHRRYVRERDERLDSEAAERCERLDVEDKARDDAEATRKAAMDAKLNQFMGVLLPLASGLLGVKLPDLRVNPPARPSDAVRARADALVGTPFISLPGITDHSAILWTMQDGTRVSAQIVEEVFNDSLLMDAINNWGEFGPLYYDTLDPRQREVYEYALKAYAGVEIPEKLRKPGVN